MSHLDSPVYCGKALESLSQSDEITYPYCEPSSLIYAIENLFQPHFNDIIDSYERALSEIDFSVADSIADTIDITQPFFDPFLDTNNIGAVLSSIFDFSSPEMSTSIAETLDAFTQIVDLSNNSLLSGELVANQISNLLEIIAIPFSESAFKNKFEDYQHNILSNLENICHAEQSAATPSDYHTISFRVKKILQSVIFTALPILLPMLHTQYLHNSDVAANQKTDVQLYTYIEESLKIRKEQLEVDKEQLKIDKEQLKIFQEQLQFNKDHATVQDSEFEIFFENFWLILQQFFDNLSQNQQQPPSDIPGECSVSDSVSPESQKECLNSPVPDSQSDSFARLSAGDTNDVNNSNTSK